MHRLTLVQANTVIEAAFAKGGEMGLKPLTVVVLDPGGHMVAAQRQDGTSNIRVKLAAGKASGALALGVSSRKIGEMALDRPHFVASLHGMAEGGIVPVAGGVIAAHANGAILGAVGVTGDTSDNDEICAIAGIEAAGLRPRS